MLELSDGVGHNFLVFATAFNALVGVLVQISEILS